MPASILMVLSQAHRGHHVADFVVENDDDRYRSIWSEGPTEVAMSRALWANWAPMIITPFDLWNADGSAANGR